MISRTEKYKDKAVKSSRSSRNQNLYNTMYSSSRYSNIEGVASIDKGNEIDITKVKEMIDERERPYRTREYRNPDRQTTSEIPIVRNRYTESSSNYDIMDVLKEAKEKEEPDNKNRNIDNSEYDVLKKLNLNSKPKTPIYKKVDEEEELKDLIETISNTSMMNKIEDDDMAFTMFKELTDDDDEKANDVNDLTGFGVEEMDATMDDSFFTGKIKKSDYFGKTKKSGKGKKGLITILVLFIVIGGAILLLYNFGFFDKFK